MNTTSPLIVLKGGTIVDGTGKTPPYQGDVIVKNGKIIDVQAYANNMPKQAPSNAQVIDCRGKAITPGWIDQHTHYDGQVTWDPYLSPSANCGVTTVLMGNCGIGFAPIRQGAKDRQFLLDLVDAVEDVPGAALNVGIDWSWETFPQYMNKLESLDLAIDVAVLIGHAPVRAYVLGERANLSDLPGGPQNDEITKAEIDRMASIIEEAVAEGAMGFSTSRIILHRDKSGDLTPGTMAQEAEMLAIGRAIAAGGGGVFEGAFDFGTYDDVPRNQADKQKMELFAKKEWHWMSQVAKHYRVPFSFATDSNRVEMMRQFNMAENENLFYAQMFIRPQGNLLSMQSRTNPFRFTDTFKRLVQSGHIGKFKTNMELMRSSEVRNAILKEAGALVNGSGRNSDLFKLVMGNDSLMRRTFKWTRHYESYDGVKSSVAYAAQQLNVPNYVVLYDWMCEDGTDGNDYAVLWRPQFGRQSVSRDLFDHDFVLPGVADGGAHGTVLTDATANTSMITQFVRDRPISLGRRMSLELAVAKQTGQMATLYQLNDRGVIAPGMKADINVIDIDKLNVNAPKYVNDLPEGAARWIQSVDGYLLTMVNGFITFKNGQPTGILPGGLVRNPRSRQSRELGIKRDLVPYETLLSGIEILPDINLGENMKKGVDRDAEATLAMDDAGASGVGRAMDMLDSKL